MCNRKAFYQNWDQSQMGNFRKHRRHQARKFWKEKFKAAFNYPPVNVLEEDDKFVLHVYAPGLNKSDFLIATIDNTLRYLSRSQAGRKAMEATGIYPGKF